MKIDSDLLFAVTHYGKIIQDVETADSNGKFLRTKTYLYQKRFYVETKLNGEVISFHECQKGF